jgi:hypothetical protein
MEDKLIGLHFNKAVPIMQKHKLEYRIVSDDGKIRVTTRDYKPERLNLFLEKGIVKKITKG